MKVTNSMKPFAILGLLAILHGSASSDSNCDDNSKLQYEAGKSYVYNVELVSYDSTRLGYESEWATQTGRGKITTSGKVILTALESCQFAITLHEATTVISAERIGHEAASKTGPVPRTSMLFTYRNGEVSNLHKVEGEASIWTENLLRGILTMIQNKGLGNSEGEPEEKETTIRGECISTIYIPSEGQYKKTIMTAQCSEPVITPSEGVPYDNAMYALHRPHFHSSHLICHQNLTNGLVSAVSCSEMSELPLPREFREQVEAVTSLHLEESAVDTNQVGGATSDEIALLTESTCMKYDARLGHADSDWEKNVLEEVVSLTKAMHLEGDLNRAELYLKLKEIQVFVKDYEKLEQMIQAESGEDSMKFQFMANMVRNVATEIVTEGAVVYISNLIHTKVMTPGQVAVFHAHLYLTKDATLEGLKALNVIVQDTLEQYNEGGFFDTVNIFSNRQKVIRQQVLGVSAYAYQFCRKNSACGELPEYQELISKIAQFAASTRPDIAHAALHALGNVPSLPDSAIKVIRDTLRTGGSLFKGGETKMLTAFEAFRRDPCSYPLKKVTRKILADDEKPLEIRVPAYLAMVRCMDKEDLKVIEEILLISPESPLSSFIASHVYNIMDSQSPSKTSLKSGPLSQIVIPESTLTVHNRSMADKFVEYSTFNPETNMGFSADATLLFKGGEPVPQFIHANLTFDVLGKSYNHFQAGLSSRLMPSFGMSWMNKMMNFFDVSYNEALMKLIPLFFAMDSYYRVYGTTVTMGVDAVDALQAHQFFNHGKDPETGVMRFDFVKAFTLIQHEMRMPTVSGLPLTFTTQMAYLPMVSANHSGNQEATSMKDLLTRWDEASGSFSHNSTSNSAFVAGIDISVGKGTPVQMGYHAVAKVQSHHSIGFESEMQEDGWIKTIHFPDVSVASLRLTAVRQFFVEYDGHESQKWNLFGDMTPAEHEDIFRFGGMGLEASGQMMKQQHHGPAPIDMVFKIEKTEEQFTGYGLAIELKDEGESKKFGLKAMAYGLSTEDTVHLYINYTDLGVYDLESSDQKPSRDLSVYADMTQRGRKSAGFHVIYKSTGQPKSVLAEYPGFSESASPGILFTPTFGIITRPEYFLQVESIDDGENVRLLDWTINNDKKDANWSMKFSGSLEKLLGEVNGMLSLKDLHAENQAIRVHSRLPMRRMPMEGLELKSEISQNSEELGHNRATLTYKSENEQVWCNHTVQIGPSTYELTEHLHLPNTHEEHDQDGKVVKRSYNGVAYRADYRMDEIHLSAEANYNDLVNYLEDNQATYLKNASLRLTSADAEHPLIIEATFLKDMDNNFQLTHNGLKRWTANVYVDSFGKKEAELTYDKKYTETGVDTDGECMTGGFVYLEYQPKDGKHLRCATITRTVGLVVANHIEFLSTFSNEKRHEMKYVVTAYHTGSDVKFNLTFDHNFPPERNAMGVENKLVILLENVGENRVDWKSDSSLDIDLENRTADLSSETKRGKPEIEEKWTTSASATWEDTLWNGESTLKIHHECPHHTATDVEITNKANQTGHFDNMLFTNSLTAIIDSRGKTKILLPKKKFTWDYVSDTRLTPEERNHYDFCWKPTSEMRLWRMTEQPEEIFHYVEALKLYKQLEKEIWLIKEGHSSLSLEGKEKGALDWNMALHIIPEQPGHVHHHEGENTDISHFAPTSSSSMHIKLMANVDGWFVQEEPALQNNTLRLTYAYELFPHDTRLKCDSDFAIKKVDIGEGKDVFKLDVKANKNYFYHDILHFHVFEKVYLDIDNKIWSVVKKIRLNGPHLLVHIVSDGETDEDSWLIDFDGGMYEEKHQHKLNFRSKSGSKADHAHHHELNHHHPRHGSIIPYTNFNITISRH